MQCMLATIFDFELSQKKVVSDSFDVHLNVSKFIFCFFNFFIGKTLIKLN